MDHVARVLGSFSVVAFSAELAHFHPICWFGHGCSPILVNRFGGCFGCGMFVGERLGHGLLPRIQLIGLFGRLLGCACVEGAYVKVLHCLLLGLRPRGDHVIGGVIP